MLNNLTDQLSVESTSLLKDALVGIVDKITVDDKKMLATVKYKIAYSTGNKLASPRGEKASSYLAGLKTFKYKASSQFLSVETLSNLVTPIVTLSP